MLWFSSDHHFLHGRVIEYAGRPFADVDEQTEVMIERHNSVVRPQDKVIFVGDFALGRRRESVPLVQRMNGHITLVSGNHDDTFQLHSKWTSARRKYIEWGFDEVVNGLEYTLDDGTEVLIDHFPYYGDHEGHEERYPELRPRDDGKWLLHGHVHELWKVRDHMINVGVDVWDFYPVSQDQILEIIHG